MKEPTYLGDGVYAQFDQFGMLILTTGSHELRMADNTIMLEPEVLEALLNFLK
jgi:hypothetical protein